MAKAISQYYITKPNRSSILSAKYSDTGSSGSAIGGGIGTAIGGLSGTADTESQFNINNLRSLMSKYPDQYAKFSKQLLYSANKKQPDSVPVLKNGSLADTAPASMIAKNKARKEGVEATKWGDKPEPLWTTLKPGDIQLPPMQFYFKDGGEVDEGRPIVVGEEGPEVFVPETDGEVVPNNKLRSFIDEEDEVGKRFDEAIKNAKPGEVIGEDELDYYEAREQEEEEAANKLRNVPMSTVKRLKKFDPEGDDYDYESAESAGMRPNVEGHWSSRNPKTGQMLKGRKHKTWGLAVEGEKKAGYKMYKGKDGKYYSKKIKKTVNMEE